MAHDYNEYMRMADDSFVCPSCLEKGDLGCDTAYFVDNDYICENCKDYAISRIASPAKHICECAGCGDISDEDGRGFMIYDGEAYCRYCMEDVLNNGYKV